MKINSNILIGFFGLLKLLIHLFTNTNYGLHRDEFLYFDQSKHLDWGFMEVPPMTPFFGKIADLLGGSVFAIRLFPALVGVATVILAGHLVKSLGGKNRSIAVTCLALIFTPALLGSDSLFQPVGFIRFFWFLSALFLVKIIQTEQPKYWYALGVCAGLGFLTKYSILFYFTGLIIAVLLTPQRKLFKTKYPYIAFGIAFFVALPNILWQANHHYPVLAHMSDLSETQLVHIDWGYFLWNQITAHFSLTLIWLAGFSGLFLLPELKKYRFAGFALLITVFIIGALSGKGYYARGAYTILFCFGGLTIEKYIQKDWITGLGMALLILISVPVMPYYLHVFKIDKMQKYCAYMAENFGFESRLRWEDGKYYPLPQDHADMHGWEELTQKVAKIYHELPEEKREKCMIYGGGYAHASSINYFREKYNLPEAVSFNSSYIIWAPEDYDFDNQIMIDDVWQELESSFFHEMTFRDSIENPFAREPGYIYYRQNPKIDVRAEWKKLVTEQKSEFGF